MEEYKLKVFDLYECWYLSNERNVLEVKCIRLNELDKRIELNRKIIAIPSMYNIEKKKDYIRKFMSSDVEIIENEISYK